MKTSLYLVLLSLVLVTDAQPVRNFLKRLGASRGQETPEQDGNDGGVFANQLGTGLGTFVCNRISNSIFLRNVQCECDFGNGDAGVLMTCTRPDLCTPFENFCASLQWTTTFAAGVGQNVTSEVCVTDVTVGLGNFEGPQFDDICTEYEVNPFEAALGLICPDGLIPCILGLLAGGGLGGGGGGDGGENNDNEAMALTEINACTMTIGGQECNSCITCDDEGGVYFDCSNIRENFVSVDGECSNFHPLLSLTEKVEVELPNLPIS